MGARVFVHTPEEYDAWAAQRALAPAEEEAAS
jgi:heme/copper-type cytochrome/quinol oxidase subunit 2